MIYTTIYLQDSLCNRLNGISRATGMPVTSLIIILLKKNSIHNAELGRAWIRIRYQPRQKERKCTRIHIRLSPAEYEFILDLRRVHKRSVSFLISLSADKYLNDILNRNSRTDDNNRINAYTFSKIFIDGATCWMHIWGAPVHSAAFHAMINNSS